MIIAGDRYALTEKENNMYAIEMILHIKRLQSSDFGGYKCISKNSIGDTEGTIRLYGKKQPSGILFTRIATLKTPKSCSISWQI